MKIRETDISSQSGSPLNRTETPRGILWPRPADFPILRSGQIHIWSASIDVEDERYRYFEGCLTHRELKRADRYVHELTRRRFVCARGLLKEILGKYTGVDPSGIAFDLGRLGKPYLPQEISTDLQFNSTDTSGEALFAVCRSAEIGIDIEFTDRKVRHQIIAPRKFTDAEQAHYCNLPETQQKEFFLKVWTRKEAYGKAKGVGIKYRLNSVNLVDESDSDRLSVIDSKGTTWEVIQISPATDITAAVVVEGTGWQIESFRLEGSVSSF